MFTEEAYAEYVDVMSGAYDERCKQTELDALRADHFDPHGMEFDEADRVSDEEARVFAAKAAKMVPVAPEDEPPF